jgi:hypothetical protein
MYLLLIFSLFLSFGYAKVNITNYENGDKFIRDSNSYGIYRFKDDKEVWIGEVRDDKFNGISIIRYKNGNIDIVYQESDKISDAIKVEIRPDYIYLGSSKSSNKDGVGIFSWVHDKHTYIGEFRDNKKDGMGAYILPNDDIKVGIFDDNKFEPNSKIVDTNIINSNSFEDSKDELDLIGDDEVISYESVVEDKKDYPIYVDRLECSNINQSFGFWKCRGVLINSTNHLYKELSLSVTLFDREDNISKIKSKTLNTVLPNSQKSFQVLIQTRDMIKSYSATVDNLY